MANKQSKNKQEDTALSFLTPSEQLVYLKKLGVQLNNITEAQCIVRLCASHNLVQLKPYIDMIRSLSNSEDQETPIDFETLTRLASLNDLLGEIVLPMVTDIEHVLKLKILNEAAEHIIGDDKAIIHTYLKSLTDHQRKTLMTKINVSYYQTEVSNSVPSNPYDMPVWAFMDLLQFKDLCHFGGYCGWIYNESSIIGICRVLSQSYHLRNLAGHDGVLFDYLCRPFPQKLMDKKYDRPLSITFISAMLQKKHFQAAHANLFAFELFTIIAQYFTLVHDAPKLNQRFNQLKAYMQQVQSIQRSLPPMPAFAETHQQLQSLLDRIKGVYQLELTNDPHLGDYLAAGQRLHRLKMHFWAFKRLVLRLP